MTEHRRSQSNDPTAERTADQSTPSASGLTAGREGPGVERNREADDPARPTSEERDTTPRRYDQRTDEDPVLPPDGPTLRTEM